MAWPPTPDANGWSVFLPKADSGTTDGVTPLTWAQQQGTNYGASSYNNAGTSVFAPTVVGDGTRITYISTSGSDSTGDGSFTKPYATAYFAHHFNGALRDGKPDWLLLKKGDTFSNQPIGVLSKSGLSSQYPMIIASYDQAATQNPPVPNPQTSTARPLINMDSSGAISSQAVAFQDQSNPLNYFAVMGIKFYAWKRDPGNLTSPFSLAEAASAVSGFGVLTASSDCVLCEDCYFGYMTGALSFQPNNYNNITNGVIRRNQFIGSYPTSAGNCNGVGLSGSTTTSYLLEDNLIDRNGWNTDGYISWASPSGQNHNIYLNGCQINGDETCLMGSVTFTGNIVSNEGSAPALRVSGNYTQNLFLQNPRNISLQQPNSGSYSVSNNVLLGAAPSYLYNQTKAIAVQGIELIARYINERVNLGAASLASNIISCAVKDPDAAAGVTLQDNLSPAATGSNGTTTSGNILYNWCANSPSSDLLYQTGGIYSVSITTNAGSGYIANSLSIVGAESTNTYTYAPFEMPNTQNNIVLTLDIADVPKVSYDVPVWLNGALYQTGVIDSTHIVLFGSTYNGVHTYTSDTLYYPWYRVPLTGGSGTGAQADLIVGPSGSVVAAWLYGTDLGALETPCSSGINYVNGDVFSAAPHTGSNNGSSSAFSNNGGAGTAGSGLQLTATICSNTMTGITTDPLGQNLGSWTDPNRSAGSYYATLSGATANATFTGSITAGVLTTSSTTGTISLGDAITWSGQSKADYVKTFSSGTYQYLVGVTSASATVGAVYRNNGHDYTVVATIASKTQLILTGTTDLQSSGSLAKQSGTGDATITFAGWTKKGTNGVYNLASKDNSSQASAGSVSMSSYTSQQLINAMQGQSKANWNTALTADAVNTYIRAGFGVGSSSSETPGVIIMGGSVM